MDGPNARRSDPHTSHKAATDIRLVKEADRARVYKVFFEHHPTPLAHFQIDIILGGAQNGRWRKRCGDLHDDMVIKEVDTIINPHTKEEVIRWGLVDATQPYKPRQPGAPRALPSPKRWEKAARYCREHADWLDLTREERDLVREFSSNLAQLRRIYDKLRGV